MAEIKTGDIAKKPRNSALTKHNILRAAQQVFSRRGYAGTGLREIAEIAAINVALITRYFGSKENLFEAALEDSLSLAQLLDCKRENFGKHVVKILIDQMGDRLNPLALMVLASSDPVARAITVRVEQELIIRPLAKWLGAPNAESRAMRITMLCTGFTTYQDLLPLSGKTRPATRRWLEMSLQQVVDAAE